MRLVLVLCLMLAASAALAEETSQTPAEATAEPEGTDDKTEWPLPDYAAQQMCYTWIALTAGFGEPPEIRPGWEKVAYRISRSISGRMEGGTAEGKKASDEAIAVANEWIMSHATAHVEDKVRMVVEVMAKAKGCMDMVPPEEVATPEQPDAPEDDLQIDPEL
jgi:hypothetical protein